MSSCPSKDRLPLDPDGGQTIAHVTEIHKLRQTTHEASVDAAAFRKINNALRVTISAEKVLEDCDGPCPHQMVLGDRILKVNGAEVNRKQLITALETAEGPLSLVFTRRMFASPVPPEKALALRLDSGGGFTHLEVTCAQASSEELEASLGFKFVTIGNKFYVLEVAKDTPAERCFAVGDAILDCDGVIISPNGHPPQLLHQAFTKNGKFTSVIERPVNEKCRRLLLAVLQSFIFVAPTAGEDDVRMSDDASKIGFEAAYFHKHLLKKLNPASIIAAKSSKRKKKKGDEQQPEPAEKFQIEKNHRELMISSDVEDATNLQVVEQRYTEEESESPKGKKQPAVPKKRKMNRLFAFLANALD